MEDGKQAHTITKQQRPELQHHNVARRNNFPQIFIWTTKTQLWAKHQHHPRRNVTPKCLFKKKTTEVDRAQTKQKKRH